MNLSTFKAFLFIIVLASLTFECNGQIDKDCLSEECRSFVANCLNCLAQYYKIALGSRVVHIWDKDDNHYKVFSSLQCAKNVLRFKTIPKVCPVWFTRIDDKAIFCGYVKPVISLIDLNSPEAKNCMDQLKEFPNKAKEALEYAFTNEVLGFFKQKPDGSDYMNHLIQRVQLDGSVTEPFQFCINEFNNKMENTQVAEANEEEETTSSSYTED